MDRLIYTAVSGMNASMARQRMIASNMANAQTIGFRAEVMVATPQTLVDPRGAPDVRAMTAAAVSGASMKPGALIQTGRELDLALTGDAMLTVQAPDGGEAYTRRGDLSVSATGLLQNGDGLPLIGESGAVTVPLGSRISVAPDGAVMAFDPAIQTSRRRRSRGSSWPAGAARSSKRILPACSAPPAAACCRLTRKRGFSPARSNSRMSIPRKCWSKWSRRSGCMTCGPRWSPPRESSTRAARN